MRSVKVERKELLNKLKENMEKHISTFNEAISGYAKEAEKALRAKIKELKKDPQTNLYIGRDLIAPISYEKNYKTEIAMLEMSTEDIVQIDEFDFKRYIMDEWEWKQDFILSNSKYTSSK